MNAGIFALAGAVLGIAGTLLADMLRFKKGDARERRETLRRACEDLTTALIRMRQVYLDHYANPAASTWRTPMWEAHNDARLYCERLKLTAGSENVQLEARYAMRYGYGLWRQLNGEAPRADERDAAPIRQLDVRLTNLYVAVRKELGMPNPSAVLSEPDFFETLPVVERPAAYGE
jgi:hypothetical protein